MDEQQQLPFRVQRIFDSLFNPEVQDNVPSDMPVQKPSPDELIQGLLRPQNTASDRLNEMMTNQPNRDDFKPSFWRKLGGGLISINDERAGEGFTNRKFNNAMADWNTKLKPIAELATVEKGLNASNRQAGTALLRDQNADEEHARKIAKDEADAQAKANALAQKDRFLAYKQYVADHPNHVYKSDKEGHVYAVNPQTNEIEYLTTPEGDFVEDSKLPEQERLRVQQNNAMTQIAARGNEARKNISAQGEKEEKIEAVKQPNRVALKTTTPGKNTEPVKKVTEERVPVIDKNGKPGTVPRSQLEAAKAQGYKEVGQKQGLTGVGLNLKPVVRKTGF